MNRSRLGLLAALLALAGAFFAFDLQQWFSLATLQERHDAFEALYRERPAPVLAAFFAAYVAVAALSLPGAAVMTLAGGALFGLVTATVVVSFASSIGATLAFLAGRFLFRDAVTARFGERLKAIDSGIARDGAFYLFTLRLVPLFPFFAVNLVMALTRMKVVTFYWVSQLGMLAGTIAYVNAGTQLSQLRSAQDILSPGLVGSLVAVGVMPLLAKRLVDAVRARRVYAGWRRPARFDRNLVVIGAGAAGLVSAYIGATVRARVTLVEKHRMGGDCLNTGCVPSKALLRTARFLSDIRRAPEFGIRSATVEFEFADVMARVRRVIRDIEPHDSVARYSALGVECLEGEARIVSPWAVEVRTPTGTRTLTTRAIIVATGARPVLPSIPGIEAVGCLTSETVWDLTTLPGRLLVLGGGPIGVELAQAFARLGARVTLVESQARLLAREDPEVSDLVQSRFREEGIDVRVAHRAVRFAMEGEDRVLYAAAEGGEVRILFDEVLCAAGRVARTSGFGLEALGIPVTPAGTIEVNAAMATRYPNIFACGDVAGPYQFTHTAAHAAWYAAVNALFGWAWTFRADFSVVPRATFTDPEVARVGLSETEALAQGIAHEVTRYGLDDLDRAIADSEARGLVKVLTVPGGDRILGVTIVGAHAAEVITEFVAAMRHGHGLGRILATIHIYPTFAEAGKYVAGNWRKARAPGRLLGWLERYHAWRRG